MKLLFCMKCGDIIAPHRGNFRPRWCDCSAYAIWWRDGVKGVATVYSRDNDRRRAFILGINNALLMWPGNVDADAIRTIHEQTPASYLFKRFGTPLIRIRPGESGDTSWASELPVTHSGEIEGG